jgi:CRISPR-associated endonuclease/helicase Cas3
MAESTSPSGAATRWLETSRGILSYSQLAPLLAERVLRVQERIEAGEFDGARLDEELVRRLHGEFCGDLVPDFAGRWRAIPVQVGTHEPPLPHQVPLRMRDYVLDLAVQMEAAGGPEGMPDALAFAEGRLLSIHPFADFNGRLTRLWLWELLRRLRLPPVALVPGDEAGVAAYLAALRAGDGNDFRPLSALWQERLAGGGE